MSDSDILIRYIDARIEQAMNVVMQEVNKLGTAHNHIVQDVLPPIISDYERRKAEEDKSLRNQIEERDRQIEALQKMLKDKHAIVIPDKEE